MASQQALKTSMLLPEDADSAVLLGRVWSDRQGGPCPVVVRGGQVLCPGTPGEALLVVSIGAVGFLCGAGLPMLTNADEAPASKPT